MQELERRLEVGFVSISSHEYVKAQSQRCNF